jgi:hypothetical protein
MAKKNKKFKKKISQNLAARIAQIEQERPQTPQVQETTVGSDQSPKNGQVVNGAKVVEDDSGREKYAYVRRDIRRNLIVILILLLIVATLTVLNEKTSYLKQVADWIYTTLNLKV